MSAVDPVCRTKVNEGHAAATAEYARRMYFFCKLACKAEFERNPDRYVSDLDARAADRARR
jgi:YHS domain-containing protein